MSQIFRDLITENWKTVTTKFFLLNIWKKKGKDWHSSKLKIEKIKISNLDIMRDYMTDKSFVYHLNTFKT